MDDLKRQESGASEVIGAVLLVSLVVIGGAVIAAFAFGQPTPKEVPRVNFGVSLDNKTQNLTLHHTGGDTLLPGEYNVTVYYTDGEIYRAPARDISYTWSSDGNLNITHVTKAVGDVVLSYIDGAGGETVLRRVPFEDHSLRGVISGYKYNVTGGGKVPWTVTDPRVTINIYRKDGSAYTGVYSRPVDATGHYSYTLPVDVWGVYRVEEVVPDGWDAVSPPHGSRQVDVTTSSPNKQVDFENRLLPVTTTKTTRPTETTTQTVVTPTPTAIPTASISGIKYKVNETGVVQGTVAGVTIVLERLDGNKWTEIGSTTTGQDGSYTFPGIPEYPPATYRIREIGLDIKMWYIYNPVGGAISGVVPGGTGYNFYNQMVAPNGIVMYLNKTVEPGCPGGHVVDGTYLQGEANGGDVVKFIIDGKEKKYTFRNNEQFRFTIAGNQTSGELKIEHDALTRLTFNVTFQVRDSKTGNWITPSGFEGALKPTAVSITSINKNLANEESTLSYKYPVCAPSDTTLRLNGQVWCDDRDPPGPGNDAYMWFTDLHVVHDNRYGEGLNTMWIFLEPTYNYILVQGECKSP